MQNFHAALTREPMLERILPGPGMKTEREKRDQEVQRLIHSVTGSREAEVEFQEKIRKTTSTIFEEETRKLKKTERVERPKRSISVATVGLWLIVLGVAGFVFWMPAFGGVAIVSGVAAIIWDIFVKPATQKPPRRR
jgi:Flp pilus assembly protein TadB